MDCLRIDPAKCVGCDLCAMRCSLAKTGRVNPRQSRIRILRADEEGLLMPVVCQHCDEPRCLPVCPTNAITKSAASGLVSIDATLCIGCVLCKKACPYDGPVGIPVEGSRTDRKALCDLCDGEPRCVEMCPTGALTFARVGKDAVPGYLDAVEALVTSVKRHPTKPVPVGQKPTGVEPRRER